MRETEKRIKKYQARLPLVREKIFASLALFVLAISMLGVATFSWLTLSIAPEASEIPTTIASNGNLEIALANADGTEPGVTAVGDGALAKLFQRNTTWGNLINLNDAAYGLEKVTLRPAVLNNGDAMTNLLEVPFAAADYEADGRANTDYTTEFRFTVYDSKLDRFVEMLAGDEQKESNYSAVKAVSYGRSTPVPYDDPFLNEYAAIVAEVTPLLTQAGEEFHTIALSNDLKSVTGLLSSYLSYRRNNDDDPANYDEPCTLSDVQSLYKLMKAFYDGPMTTCGEAYMKMFELYQLHEYGEMVNEVVQRNYTPYTDIHTFCAQAPADLKAMGYDITKDFSSLNTFINDWTTLSKWLAPTDSTTIEGKVENASSPTYTAVEGGATVLYNRAVSGQSVGWCQVKPYIHGLVHIDGSTGATIGSSLYGSKVATLGASEALGLAGSGEKVAGIHGGFIYNMDARVRSSKSGSANQGIRVTNLSVTFIVTVNNVTVVTSAPDKYPTPQLKADLQTINATVGAKKEVTTFAALDTYGYAIDFWVRTNAKDSHLILDGKVKMEKQPVVFELGSEKYDIYFATIETVTTQIDETGKETVLSTTTEGNHQVYQKDGVWYHVVDSTPAEGTTEQKNDQGYVVSREKRTITEKEPHQEKVVVGYSGSNRIWNQAVDEETISRYSTSQGSGSCYTFYSDDPSEKAQSLEILSALRVAFIDENAQIMAIASLNVDRAYSDPSGKVTVPLVLNSDAIDTGKLDDNEEPIRAITYLEQNKATFICALVYLDGAVIGNEHALEAKTIQGQFNIQFGSTCDLSAVVDDELQLETRKVSAKLNSNQTDVTFEGTENEDRTVTVTVTMEGATATSVSASFSRRINDNQGTRQEKIDFTSADGGRTWTATTTFPYAGEYLLREVIVDGDSCILETPCTVTVKGFTINAVMMLHGENYAYRTANSFVSEEVTVTMSAGPDGDLPETVKAVFVGDNGVTLVNELKRLDAASDSWVGDVRFGSSGTYKMSNLILENEIVDETTGVKSVDSQYFEIGATYTRTVYLGLRVNISILPMKGDVYSDEEIPDGRTDVTVASGIEFFFQKPHGFDVSLTITDEAGAVVPGLNNVTLYYTGGLDANLKWSATQKRYVGSLTETENAPVEEFIVLRNGIYKFDRVTVGSEEIRIASHAPIISAFSLASMELTSVYLIDENYVVSLSEPTGSEIVTPQIAFEFEEAATATVYGLFEKTMKEDGTGTKQYYVIPAMQGTSELSQNSYIFTIPRVNGYWELKEIKMAGINYDANPDDDVMGTFYSGTALDELFGEAGSAASMVEVTLATWQEAENYLNLGEVYPNWNDLSSDFVEDGYFTRAKVVAAVTTQTLEYPNSSVSGGLVTMSNAFMEPTALPAMKITILDFEGRPIRNVSNVVIKLLLDRNTTALNGYTTDDAAFNAGTKTTGLSYNLYPTDNGNGTYTLNAGADNVWYHGKYSVSFDYLVDKTTSVNVKDGVPHVELRTTMPTVVISAVNPSGSLETHDSAHKTTDKNSFTATSATVYFACKESTSCGVTSYEYTKSTVTITLAGIGKGTQATLTFTSNEVGDVYLFDGSNKTATYTWTANGTCVRSVGSGGGSSKTAAKELTATSFTVTYDNATYTFAVPSITINNPY